MISWYNALIAAGILLAIIVVLIANLIFDRKKSAGIIKEKEKELDSLRLRLSLNEIRPHFIFNSLLAIKQLCIEDPKTAAAALQHFATYLRANLDAVSSEELVDFDRELDCIKEYVALEQADPASGFRVVYDTEYTDFKLPLMTVEPMVENAIRHGINRQNGLITVSSRIEGDNVVVCVEDNGSGFGSETRQQAEHRSIGIQNSKDRLKYLCKGELSIINTGRGTIVRITIPLV
ncbi:MAG: histidine kinase [Lachnospiraceae bacterium]|nr:histidine kinase [Lachnospiraceae bacterium]